jgi:hypothetical protein
MEDVGARKVVPTLRADEETWQLPRNRLGHLDPATMHVLVPIDELLIGFIGATFDFF